MSETEKPPFKTIRLLGTGGSGSVYEVAIEGDPRRLAAKLLRAESSEQQDRFRREGQVVARLNHPGIVPVHAAGSLPNGTPYLLFDLAEGRTLKDVLRAEPQLTEARVLELGLQVARALGHAHAAGVVIDPGYVEARYNRASTLAELGRTDDADAGFEAVVSRDPDHFRAHLNLGVSHYRRSELAQALESYDRAIEVAPAYFGRLRAKGHPGAGRARALLAQAHHNRGMARQDSNALRDALADYELALTLDPAHPRRAVVRREMKRINDFLKAQDR